MSHVPRRLSLCQLAEVSRDCERDPCDRCLTDRNMVRCERCGRANARDAAPCDGCGFQACEAGPTCHHYALFEGNRGLAIQRLDVCPPWVPIRTDDDAAIQFVRDLEDGKLFAEEYARELLAGKVDDE